VSIYWALHLQDCLLPGLGVLVTMLGNPEAEKFCLVPAESTFTPIQSKIIHVEPNEKALKQLHMLSETAAVRTQIIHKGENAAPFELVLDLAFRSGPFR
jgi:hypothetical protein